MKAKKKSASSGSESSDHSNNGDEDPQEMSIEELRRVVQARETVVESRWSDEASRRKKDHQATMESRNRGRIILSAAVWTKMQEDRLETMVLQEMGKSQF